MKNGLTIIALSIALCSSVAFGASNISAKKAIDGANAAYKQVAKETSDQWTVEVGAIKAEKKAFDKGNFTEAEALAAKAMKLVEATKLQAKIESETWQMRVPKQGITVIDLSD